MTVWVALQRVAGSVGLGELVRRVDRLLPCDVTGRLAPAGTIRRSRPAPASRRRRPPGRERSSAGPRRTTRRRCPDRGRPRAGPETRSRVFSVSGASCRGRRPGRPAPPTRAREAARRRRVTRLRMTLRGDQSRWDEPTVRAAQRQTTRARHDLEDAHLVRPAQEGPLRDHHLEVLDLRAPSSRRSGPSPRSSRSTATAIARPPPRRPFGTQPVSSPGTTPEAGSTSRSRARLVEPGASAPGRRGSAAARCPTSSACGPIGRAGPARGRLRSRTSRSCGEPPPVGAARPPPRGNM